MYVCICKAVTERQLRAALADGAASSLRELRDRLGIASVCGKCAGCARACLNEREPAAGFTARR